MSKSLTEASMATYLSKQNIQNMNKDSLIAKLQKEISTLSKEIIKLRTENADLRSRVSLIYSYEQSYKSARETIKEIREQTNKIIDDKDQEHKKLKMKIEQMELEKSLDDLKNNRNMTLYNQKMSVVHHIEMENKVFREEVNDLKKKNDSLSRATKEKMESLEILNQLKFSQFKKRMIDNLKEAKDNVSKLNLEYMDLNGKITILQNHQLLSEIELQKEQIDNLDKENLNLKKKIFDLEKELAIHKKVEIKLVIKAKNNNTELNSFNKKNETIHDLSLKTNENNKNSTSGVTLLPINKKNFKSINSKNLLNKEKINDILSNNIINDYSNKGIKNISKSSTSYNKKFKTESEKNNYINSNIQSDRNKMYDIDFKYIKYNKIIKRKNDEIEKLNIAKDNIKNKLDNYIGKNKGLFLFLEESLNTFFNECYENLKSKNINIDIEKIKKFNFELLDKEEKYSILVLLMKYLLPLILINYDSSNLRENIFKTNINMNLINRNIANNSAEKYLKDSNFKNAFLGKKKVNNFITDNCQKFGNGNLIHVLRMTNSPNDSRIKDNKYKSLIN